MKSIHKIIFTFFALSFCFSSLGMAGYEQLCFNESDGFALKTNPDHHDSCHHECGDRNDEVLEESSQDSFSATHNHCLDVSLSGERLNRLECSNSSLVKIVIVPISPSVTFGENSILAAQGLSFSCNSGLSPPCYTPNHFLETIRLLL